MRKLFTAIVLFAGLSVYADTNVFPVLVAGGETYQNAKVVSHTLTNVLIFHDGGAARIAFTNLPEAIQKQYGYDPKQIIAPPKITNSIVSTSVTNKPPEAANDLRIQGLERLFNSRISSKYDKFDDTSEFCVRTPLKYGSEMEISAYAIIIGNRPLFKLHIVNESDEWEYLKFSHFVIIYDGKRKDLGDLDDDGSVMPSGNVLEQMIADFSLQEFREISFAKSVEAKLGITHLTFDYASRNDWRILVNHFANVTRQEDE